MPQSQLLLMATWGWVCILGPIAWNLPLERQRNLEWGLFVKFYLQHVSFVVYKLQTSEEEKKLEKQVRYSCSSSSTSTYSSTKKEQSINYKFKI